MGFGFAGEKRRREVGTIMLSSNFFDGKMEKYLGT